MTRVPITGLVNFETTLQVNRFPIGRVEPRRSTAREQRAVVFASCKLGDRGSASVRKPSAAPATWSDQLGPGGPVLDSNIDDNHSE